MGKTLGSTTIESLSMIGQWYVVSVAVVFTSKIIDTGYQERDMGTIKD